MAEFTGFTAESLRFLALVHARDSREWFEKNRGAYEEHLVTPFRALATDLAPTMRRIDRHLELRPAIGKTISRIWRDTRFSKDKSLFKQRMWLVFKRPGKEWGSSPAFWFEIGPDLWRYGMGYYDAPRSAMTAFREKIDENPAAFRRAIRPWKKDGRFELGGETYKRPAPTPHREDIADWLRRKSFYLVHGGDPDEILGDADLAERLASGYRILAPIYRYLIALPADR